MAKKADYKKIPQTKKTYKKKPNGNKLSRFWAKTNKKLVIIIGILLFASAGYATYQYSHASGTEQLLSQSKPASASSHLSNYVPSNANDGVNSDNYATTWVSGSQLSQAPQWWKVDLGAKYDLTKIFIDWYSSSSVNYTYKVEASVDNVSYVTLISTKTEYKDPTHALSGSYRYVRITTTSSNSNYAKIREAQVWGKVIESPTNPTTPTATPTLTPTVNPVQPTGSINVKDYGAIPNDGRDDTSAILSAAKAGVASSKIVYVPAGTYNTSTLTLPNGVTINGAGSSSTHLTGLLRYSSNNTIKNIKLGNSATTFTVAPNGATSNVRFEGVRFRGGDASGNSHPAIFAINDRATNGLYIDNCEFERNLGTWDPNGGSGAMFVAVDTGGGTIAKNIWITNSRYGVSNGSATGQPTFNIVFWQSEETGSGYWGDVHILNNVFETTDEFNLDFDGLWAYNYGHNNVEIKNNLIKGAGKMRGTTKPSWGYTICVEPTRSGTVIEGNTLYRGFYNTYKTTKNTTDTIFRNNIIDLRVDNGVKFYYTDYYRTINLYDGARNTISGNTIYLPPTPTKSSQVIYNNESNSVISGNIIKQ